MVRLSRVKVLEPASRITRSPTFAGYRDQNRGGAPFSVAIASASPTFATVARRSEF